ncbi:MAG: chromate transporter [Candidatus Saccharimonadaceae bacterium]
MVLFQLYLSMFFSFFKIGLFGFGGGYAMLPLIQQEVVITNEWITVGEFTDIVAISQTTPGPISFNSATFIGYKAVNTGGHGILASIFGSAICTLAVSLPSFGIMTLVCAFFFKFKENRYVRAALFGIKPAVIGLIAAAGIILMNGFNFIDYKSWIIFSVVFIASVKKVDPILLIILAAVAGFILY